jgi:hypothetical protein
VALIEGVSEPTAPRLIRDSLSTLRTAPHTHTHTRTRREVVVCTLTAASEGRARYLDLPAM